MFDGKGGHRTKIGENKTETAKTATDKSTAMTSNCIYILNCKNIVNFNNFRVVCAICLRVHSLKIYAVCILYIMGEMKIGNTKKLFGEKNTFFHTSQFQPLQCKNNCYCCLSDLHPNKQKALAQYWFHAGPPSATMAKHETNIDEMHFVCWCIVYHPLYPACICI